MSIQIFGSFSGWRSFGQVSWAFAKAVRREHIPFTILDTGWKPTYDGPRMPVATDPSAPIGIYVGYPPASSGWLKGYGYKVLVTVCESNRIPQDWIAPCSEMDRIIVPSGFCLEAFRAVLGPSKPIEVVPHGLDDVYLQPPRETLPTGHIKLLHVSGALSFPQRKGTPQLLLAFRELLKERKDVRLYLKTERLGSIEKALADLGLTDFVTILDKPTSLPPAAMRSFLQQFHAVIQPSRGEGFGIVPLEARAAGVPSLLVPETGHLAHYAKGVDVAIAPGSWAPISTQGNDAGMAPEVPVANLLGGLRALLADLPGHQARTTAWAKARTSAWLWRNVLRPFVRSLKGHAMTHREHRFGEVL